MKSRFVKRCVVSPKVQKETERHRRYLQNLVKQHRITQEALAERLGWGRTSLSQIFSGRRSFRVKYVYAILDELGVEPGEFFAGLYPESPIRRGQGSSLVNRYENAVPLLGSFPELVPGTPGFKTLYAEGDPAEAPALPELINQVGKVVRQKFFVRPLVILDGFAQWDLETLTNRLEESLHAIEHPAISTVLLLPASLLYRPLEGRIGPRTMVVPPVPICHGIVDQDHVSEVGLIFFDEVIRRFFPIVQMTEEAREALCLLSAGLPGEMVTLTRDACAYAAKARSGFVDMAAARKVWEERMDRWRGVFSWTEREGLRHLVKEPFNEGVEGIAAWLHQNAVLLQPEHEGWLSVHPALRRVI
jgi:transcriptional regulator with XRE-family HTH domain